MELVENGLIMESVRPDMDLEEALAKSFHGVSSLQEDGHTLFRAKAPLRLGLAGGGTDVSPFCDLYGSNVLNATIEKYAYCTIEPLNNGMIEFDSKDAGVHQCCNSQLKLEFDGKLDLFKAIYNRIVSTYAHRPLSFRLTSFSDAPAGSGLGGSSTMVVTILAAFSEWLGIHWEEYELAHLAYVIERHDAHLAGGKQDQYAAAFGGFNFMEFYAQEKAIINPLRIKRWIVNELESSMLIYFTGISRASADIINEQVENARKSNKESLEGMMELKRYAIEMKEVLLTGQFKRLGEIIESSWTAKKSTAKSISNHHLDEIIETAKAAGAISAKASGAGGGGFLMFIIDPVKRLEVKRALESFGGEPQDVHFSFKGVQSWRTRF